MPEIAMLEKERIKADLSVEGINRSSRRGNRTGIPTQLKERMEQSSGLSFDNVRGYYNLNLSARSDALAYTKGNRMEIGPGQERYLPHEANVMGTKAVQLSENKDDDTLIDKRAEGGVIQAKLPDGVDWDNVYEKFKDGDEIYTGRNISDSKKLIQNLNLIDDYTPDLEEPEGIRLLAHDLSIVVKRVKRKKGGFPKKDLDNLKNARDKIKDLVKNTENEKNKVSEYKNTYINEETETGFRDRKTEACTMINKVVLQTDQELKEYFLPKGDFTTEKKFFEQVRGNYEKIRDYLGFTRGGVEDKDKRDYIGFKNNYTALPNIGAYVYPTKNSQRSGTKVGTKDVAGTYIRSEINSKGKATGFNIRLSGGYRLMPNNKYTTIKINTKDGKSENKELNYTKAGIIIHEASHLILGTKDHAYGEKNIKTLDKDEAIKNADTYRIAAEIASGARSSAPPTPPTPSAPST